MRTTAIREKLHQFIDNAEEKRVKAIFTLLEDEIMQGEWEYRSDFKNDLNGRHAHYRNGGKMVSAAECDKQIKALLKKGKKK